MNIFIKNIKNILDFYVREKILKFSRKNYFEKNEDKNTLFQSNASLKNRERFLVETYFLDDLKSNSSIQNYLENLYIVDILDKYFPTCNFNSVLDVGCKNWSYSKGEYYFFSKFSNNLLLNGIEIDPNRLYSNFYTRREVAKFYVKGINANYIEGNVLNHNPKYDCITWFLPFVLIEPHMAWGLPKKNFCPKKLLAHAYSLLNKNGKIFIVNQGLDEYLEQKRLCNSLNMNYVELGEINSDFISYKKRFGLIITK